MQHHDRIRSLLVAVLLGMLADSCYAMPVKVFLFGGQSNMRGNVANAPASIRNQANVLYSYNSSGVLGMSTFQRTDWGILDQLPPNVGGQFIGRTYGPELSAGKRLAEHFGATAEAPIAIIKVSRDASRMRVAEDSWNVSLRDNPSNEAMLRIFYKQIEAALSNPVNGSVPDYEIAGMFWMQGESDANPAEGHAPAAFRQATEAMIGDIRTTLGVPEMPFYIGELGDFDGSGDSLPYRAAQMEIAAADPHTFFVSTAGLTRYTNDVHFDAPGIQGLGERFADAFIASYSVPEPSTGCMVLILIGFLPAAARSKHPARGSASRH